MIVWGFERDAGRCSRRGHGGRKGLPPERDLAGRAHPLAARSAAGRRRSRAALPRSWLTPCTASRSGTGCVSSRRRCRPGSARSSRWSREARATGRSRRRSRSRSHGQAPHAEHPPQSSTCPLAGQAAALLPVGFRVVRRLRGGAVGMSRRPAWHAERHRPSSRSAPAAASRRGRRRSARGDRGGAGLPGGPRATRPDFLRLLRPEAVDGRECRRRPGGGRGRR